VGHPYNWNPPSQLKHAMKIFIAAHCFSAHYGRFGLLYHRYESEILISNGLYINPRIGRNFNISNKFGIEIDIGAFFLCREKTIYKKHTSGWRVSFPVYPSLGIGLFYRL